MKRLRKFFVRIESFRVEKTIRKYENLLKREILDWDKIWNLWYKIYSVNCICCFEVCCVNLFYGFE